MLEKGTIQACRRQVGYKRGRRVAADKNSNIFGVIYFLLWYLFRVRESEHELLSKIIAWKHPIGTFDQSNKKKKKKKPGTFVFELHVQLVCMFTFTTYFRFELNSFILAVDETNNMWKRLPAVLWKIFGLFLHRMWVFQKILHLHSLR